MEIHLFINKGVSNMKDESKQRPQRQEPRRAYNPADDADADNAAKNAQAKNAQKNAQADKQDQGQRNPNPYKKS